MKNSDYWRERFELLEAAQHADAAAFAAEWQEEYDKAAARIQREIDAFYKKVAENEEITLADAHRMLDNRELKEFRWTLKEFEEKARENGDLRWEQELINASARVHIDWLQRERILLDQEVNSIFSGRQEKVADFLSGTFTEGRDRAAFELQIGTGVGQPLRTIDADSIEKVLRTPWTIDGRTFSDRIWMNQEKLKEMLRTKMTQAIIRGDNPSVMVDELVREFGISRSQAERLVMTESAYFRLCGELEAYKDNGVGRIEIVATLDSTTCAACGELDGNLIAMEDAEIGVTLPIFHPNCRCTTAPNRSKEMEGIGERAARGEDGDTYYVPPDTTYEKWKKQLEDAAQSVGQPPIMKPANTLKPASNPQDQAIIAIGDQTNISYDGLRGGPESDTMFSQGDYPAPTGGYDKLQPRATDVTAKIQQAEDVIRSNDFETAIVFDAKGNVLWSQSGQQGLVSFSDEQMANMKGRIVTHNHPSGALFQK